MATPSTKSPSIEVFLSKVTGRNRKATIQGNTCMSCNQAATNFKDDLSRKEYTISGLCQKCQDSVFG